MNDDVSGNDDDVDSDDKDDDSYRYIENLANFIMYRLECAEIECGDVV